MVRSSVDKGDKMASFADRGQQKWALLIGINEYPEWAAKYHLAGCINDVNAIEELLTGELFGFPPAHVLKLTSPADDAGHLATRANILDAFRSHLIENTRIQPGDVVVVYYSGHGSYVRDVHGDEEDACDETLVPCDSGPDHAQDIVDDEVAVLLDELAGRTRNVNLFFDSCHSGTVTRALLDAEEADAQGQARWLPPPDDAVAIARATRPARRATRSLGPGGWMPLSEGYVAISACHALERARERLFLAQLKRHGILTYCLLAALRDVGPETTYYDIWCQVQTQVNRWCGSQNPQIEGAFERKVFGGAALPRQRYVEVTGKDGDTVTLAAGLVHGATVGSRFAIYPHGTQTFEANAARVAVVRLTEVGTLRSVGALEGGDIAHVTPGAPAVEIEHDYGKMQMAVRVAGDDQILDAVRQSVKASPLLILTEAGEGPSTATVRLRHPLTPDGCEDRSRDQMLCILSSGAGRALVEPVTPDAEGPAQVCAKLEHVARYYNILAIRNTDVQSKLQGKVRLRLLKVSAADEQQVEPVGPDAGGNLVLKVGDRVYVEVENGADQPLHVAIFDCSPEWEVRPIFPIAGATDDQVGAHRSRRTIRFRVNLENPEMVHENLPLPQETLKVIATTRQTDFRSLWLSRMRALEEQSSLAHLIGLATGGGPTRAVRSLEEADEDWTTDELVFHIVT